MPLVDSHYQPPWYFLGGHLQTIVPALRRQASRITTEKERLELADGDFLDLEWHRRGQAGGSLAILCHGLEANAGASYIQEMAAALSEKGWDVLAWSYRGCSGEMNRLPRFYHSGATEDLSAVVEHALQTHCATRLDLVGFSLGGNLILKYLGERAQNISPRLNRAVAFSVPCDLACSSQALDTAFNRAVYMRRFIKSLSRKVRQKHALFPEKLDLTGLKGARSFRQFDDRYTAPLHGFTSAQDYWQRSSSRPFLSQIRIPTLLVNALNDPFLGPRCYPEKEAQASAFFTFEAPPQGGHVGFPGKGEPSWIASRTLQFLKPSP